MTTVLLFTRSSKTQNEWTTLFMTLDLILHRVNRGKDHIRTKHIHSMTSQSQCSSHATQSWKRIPKTKQPLARKKTWQRAKHVKLYSDLLLALNETFGSTLVFQGSPFNNSRFSPQDSFLLTERRTRDRKVARSNLRRSGWRNFFSRVNSLCRLLFGGRSTPV